MKKRYVIGVIVIGAGIAAWRFQDRIMDKVIDFLPELDDDPQDVGLPLPGSKAWSDILKGQLRDDAGLFVASVAEASRQAQQELDDDTCVEHATSVSECASQHDKPEPLDVLDTVEFSDEEGYTVLMTKDGGEAEWSRGELNALLERDLIELMVANFGPVLSTGKTMTAEQRSSIIDKLWAHGKES